MADEYVTRHYLVTGRIISQKSPAQPSKEQVMSDPNKPNVIFQEEKSGDTDKYKSTVGVRADASAPTTAALREEMKAKMTSTTLETVIDFGNVLSDPDSKAIKFGVVGVGHGGSRLAEQFHQFGYKVCVVNTAKQDLAYINLPQSQKYLVNFALGGVGKDIDLGETAVVESQEEIKAFLNSNFDEDASSVDQFILCIGGGGGTGSGSTVPMIQLLSDYNLPITVLYTLPMTSEGTVTKWNAVVTLDKLSKLAVNQLINGLVVIDNSRIEEIYANVSLGNFFKVANFDIANIFNSFNTMSSLPTDYMAIDPMDFARVISSGNCMIYGKLELPLSVDAGHVEVAEDDIAQALVHNIQNSLLAEGFDISQAMRAGVYITGKSKYLNQIPASAFNFAFASLNEQLGKADLFKGVYPDERLEDKLIIYTLITGLGLPRDRIESLKEQAQEDINEMESKESDSRQKMAVFEQTTNKESDKYRQQKKSNSAFGKMANRAARRNRN